MAEQKSNTINSGSSSSGTNTTATPTKTNKYLSYKGERVTNESKISEQASELKDTGTYADGYTYGSTESSVPPVESNEPTEPTNPLTGGENESDGGVQSSAQDLVDYADTSEAELKRIKDKATADAKANKIDDAKRAKDQATAQQTLINEQNDRLKELQEGQEVRYDKEKEAEIRTLKDQEANVKAQTELERQKLNAEAEYQRVQNKNAIIEANANIDKQRQESAWAYQKLGLGFSGGIINQSQQIATDGYAKIAEIKAKMNYNEALIGVKQSEITLKLEEIGFKYTSAINKTISSYSDKLDILDLSVEKRIKDTQSSLLLSNQAKDNKIDEIFDKYNETVNTLEKDHISDMFKVKELGLKYEKEVEAQIEKTRERGLENLNEEILSGNVASMNELEISQMEDSLDLPRGTIKARTRTAMVQGIRTAFDTAIGEDYQIENIDSMLYKVDEFMKQGRGLEEAIKIVSSREIRGTDEYKDKSTEEALAKDDKEKARRARDEDRAYELEQRNAPAKPTDDYTISGGYKLNKKTGEYEKLEQSGVDSSGFILGGSTSSGGITVGGKYNGYPVTQVFGTKGGPNSKDTGANGGTPGIDIAIPSGTALTGFTGGKVVSVYNTAKEGDKEANSGYGNQIVIEKDGVKHYYSHLDGVNVKVGDEIDTSTPLGTTGNTGYSTGAHLDYRTKGKDGWVNPDSYMTAQQDNADAYNKERRDVMNDMAVAGFKLSADEKKLGTETLKAMLEKKTLETKTVEDTKARKETAKFTGAINNYLDDQTNDSLYGEVLKEGRAYGLTDDSIFKKLNPTVLKDGEKPTHGELSYSPTTGKIFIPGIIFADEMDGLRISDKLKEEIKSKLQ